MGSLHYIRDALRITIITILISILFTQCKEPEDVYYKIPQEDLDWVNFKEGSWWIYREINSGYIDTFIVESYDLKPVKSEIKHNYDEHLFIKINSITRPDSFCIFVSSIGPFIQITSDQTFKYWSYLVHFPLKENEYFLLQENYNQKVIFDSVMTEYQLDTFNFKNVVRAYDNKNAVYYYKPTKFYTCKGVGIIRKEFLNTGEIWNLM